MPPQPSFAPTPATPLPPSLRLVVSGLGHVPGFKNSKKIIRNPRTKALMIVSDSGLKKRMDAITQSFVSQLRSALATASAATPTGAPQPSLILSLPQDDNWEWVPELVVTSRLVPKGQEGAEIVIERLTHG